MAVNLTLAAFVRDAFLCIGLGTLPAAFYTAVKIFIGKNKLLQFLLDMATFLFAGLLVFSYSVRSASGNLRPFMAFFAAGGYLCAIFFIMPSLVRGADTVKKLLAIPAKRANKYLVQPLLIKLKVYIKTQRQKAKTARAEKIAKRRQSARGNKKLQKQRNVLYNSN